MRFARLLFAGCGQQLLYHQERQRGLAVAERAVLYVLFLLLMLLMLALGVYLLVVGCQQGNPPVLLAPFSPHIIGGFFRHV